MSTSPDPFEAAHADAEILRAELGGLDTFVVLGSGFSEVAAALLGADATALPHAALPHAPRPSVAGHRGELWAASLGSQHVVCSLGRAHLYEGRSPAEVVHLVRTAIYAGASTVILTNAAGSLRPEWGPGTLVALSDHLNLSGVSPLTGTSAAVHGPRFPDMSAVYDPQLRAVLRGAEGVEEGVYASLPGPSYETPAEVRMLRALGADLVGMSTTLEAIAAVHLGVRVCGLSLVTNLAAGVSPVPLDHAEVVAAGAAATPRITQTLAALLAATSSKDLT